MSALPSTPSAAAVPQTDFARNAAAFARQHLRKEAVACYWWRLLTAWARHQPQGSRTDGFTPL